jgi:uncharacterized protein
MKNAFSLSVLSMALGISSLTALADHHEEPSKKILVVTVTKGFRHSSIPTAEKVLGEIGKNSGDFTVDYARNDEDLATKMSAEGLANYDGVFFANTTGDLPIPSPQAFLNWIKSGNAFMGAHSSSDTFHGFPPFIDMIGGEFRTHGPQVEVKAINEDPNHPATRHYPAEFKIFDEIYLFKSYHRDRVHSLLNMDVHPNQKVPGHYPISWCKAYGNGRMFYTSLGHREDIWENAEYQKHVLGGIRYALKLEEGDSAPQDLSSFVSAEEYVDGFRPLFNGVDLTGWKLRHEDGTASWSAQSGMLVNEIPQGGHGTDIVTEDTFYNFTIRYEYMVSKGSNSGLYLRGRHEIQIYDDYDSQTPGKGGNGAIYSMYPVSEFASKPAGEWQTAEATIECNRVTVHLNGKLVHDNVLVDRATGGQLDDKVTEPGPILIQGDHGPIAVRNIRIKSLD